MLVPWLRYHHKVSLMFLKQFHEWTTILHFPDHHLKSCKLNIIPSPRRNSYLQKIISHPRCHLM
uniref:Uncharacterized protein n=1 Tax=Arundo donax TaxID=35708 RepID=A0A0A9E8X6_ARUDO